MKTLLWVLLLMTCAAHAASGAALSFGPFGELILRGREKNPGMITVLLSDAEGWGSVEEEMAKVGGDAGALVIGVDMKRYFAHIEEKNYEPNVSHELEMMSKYVQKTLALPTLQASFLMGHGAGGSVVYASLVQAPAKTFLGGVSLGFRPGVPLSQPFGIGRGLLWKRLEKEIRYDAVTKFELSWTVIQAEQDPAFPEASTREFIRDMRGVTLHGLSGARGYADAAAWSGTLSQTLTACIAAPSAQPDQSLDIADLPLIEVPPKGPQTDSLAVFITGDGGWAGIDKDIAQILAKNGIGVVGLDSLRYFWTRRTPEGGGADLARIMRYYMEAWDKQRVILIGFSLGADALPPMAANLPPELRQTVRQVTLLAPSRYVELEFHVSDWLHDDEASQDIALLPEVRKLEPVPMLCVYGQDEEQSLCTDLRADEATVESLPGSHHFNGEYAAVAALILEHLNVP